MSMSWKFLVLREEMKELIVVDSNPGPPEEPDLKSRLQEGAGDKPASPRGVLGLQSTPPLVVKL